MKIIRIENKVDIFFDLINMIDIDSKNKLCLDIEIYLKKNLNHLHKDVENLGGKIDKIYWVLLTVAGTALVFVLERMFG